MRIHNGRDDIIQMNKWDSIMENITEALSMGGYGFYVWGSFATAAVIIMAMLVVTLRSLKTTQRKLKNLQELQE